jgi:lipoprotein signal peptidase
MTRSSPAWLLIAFFIAFVGVGFRYWQLPYAQAPLPDSLYGPGLVAIAVVALMARAFGLARFWKVWLLIAAAVPVAVLIRIIVDTTADAASHNLWPLELVIAAALGLACSLAGTLLGSLFLLRSSKRPG